MATTGAKTGWHAGAQTWVVAGLVVGLGTVSLLAQEAKPRQVSQGLAWAWAGGERPPGQ